MMEDPTKITMADVIADLRTKSRSDLSGMVDEIEQSLSALAAHAANKGRTDFEMLGDLMAQAQMIPMYDDGIEEHLTRPLTEKFGMASRGDILSDDQQKTTLSLVIMGARLALRQSDVKQTLATTYQISDAEQLEDLTHQIDHELRWTYNGDVEAFFSDLESLTEGGGDLKERLYGLSHINTLKRFNQAPDARPIPKMI